MARGFNKVLLMGNLTRDIEMRFTPQNNTAIGNFGLAVNRSWRTPEGETREEVTFVDCEVWGKQAEIMKQYLSKGKPVFVEGRLKLDQWKDKTDGSNRSKLKVVVEEFRFIDSKGGGGGGGGGESGGSSSYDEADASVGTPQVRTTRSSSAGAAAGPSIGDADIPF